MESSSRVAAAIMTHNPQAVFIDSVGLGAGVVDRLRQLGHKIIAVNSGLKASRPERYINLKAEMWDRLKQWLLEGGKLLPHQQLKADLLAPTYSYDYQGRLKIESKNELKSRGLPSTDCADALALTFAVPLPGRRINKTRSKIAEGLHD